MLALQLGQSKGVHVASQMGQVRPVAGLRRCLAKAPVQRDEKIVFPFQILQSIASCSCQIRIGAGSCVCVIDPCVACRRKLWLLPVLAKEDRQWLLAEALEAERQPLVFAPKMGTLQMV